jgi:hypothetical protein
MLRDIQQNHMLVLDSGGLILQEYRNNLSLSGQPGVGDAFLKWAHDNQANPRACEQLLLGLRQDGEFLDFPNDVTLNGFDRSDRKFVALSIAHASHPAILNAVDTDWWHFRVALSAHGVQIQFLCPDAMSRT